MSYQISGVHRMQGKKTKDKDIHCSGIDVNRVCIHIYIYLHTLIHMPMYVFYTAKLKTSPRSTEIKRQLQVPPRDVEGLKQLLETQAPELGALGVVTRA